VKLEHNFDPTAKLRSQHIILSSVRTQYKQYRMIVALAAIILLSLNVVGSLYNEAIQAYYSASFPATFASYNIWHVGSYGQSNIWETCTEAIVSSYNLLTEHQDSSYIHYFYHGITSYNDSGKKKSRSKHWIERRDGGNGLAIACYVRVSSAHQADNGFSVDAQMEKLRKMIESINPSIVYWFVDAGMTGTKFDNRAVVEIMTLKKQGKIEELWVCEVDRIGRDAPKLIMFFFDFCEDGGRIRTPDAIYDNSHDLGAFIVLTVKAFAAQDSNQARSKASMAGKAESFRRRHWNKRIPLGYERIGEWIQRLETWRQAIDEIFASYIALKDESEIADEFNTKYGEKLNIKIKPSHIEAILTDSVYVGRAEHLGVVVVDHMLAFVDEETFRRCQDIINSRKQKQRAPKTLDALQELLTIKHVWALHFIEKEIVLVHRGCGGAVVKYGSVKYGNIKQQLFLCRKCKSEWRVPSASQVSEEQQREGILGEADLLDDARDLLREVVEKKKAERLEKIRLMKQQQQLQNQSQALEPWWLAPAELSQPRGDEPTNTDPNYGRLFGWLFQ
jgi:DNA invertase Pin-like site-specific DNA recombinase